MTESLFHTTQTSADSWQTGLEPPTQTDLEQEVVTPQSHTDGVPVPGQSAGHVGHGQVRHQFVKLAVLPVVELQFPLDGYTKPYHQRLVAGQTGLTLWEREDVRRLTVVRLVHFSLYNVIYKKSVSFFKNIVTSYVGSSFQSNRKFWSRGPLTRAPPGSPAEHASPGG